MIAFTKVLKDLRTKNGMKQSDVADELGVDRSTYTYMELGKTKPDFETILHICRIYNIDIKEMEKLLLSAEGTDVSFESIEETESNVFVLTEDEKKLLKLFRNSDNKDEIIKSICQI